MILPKRLDVLVRKLLERKGYVLMRGEDSRALERRRRLLMHGRQGKPVDLLLDVGANIGQYATSMRRLGYAGAIVSFEPMGSAYLRLARIAQLESNWKAVNYGLGSADERRSLNISQNSVSSSVLDMLPTHLAAAPRSEYVASEEIDIRRLDGVFDDIVGNAESIWLKIDVQGFEDRVLSGAERSLPRVDYIQVELSLVPLYSQQVTFLSMCQHLGSLGFDLVGLEPGFSEPSTGRLLQADGIFVRRGA